MPNQKGFLNREEVRASGKPVLLPLGEWRGAAPINCLILTRSRCEAYDCPVQSGEIPVAYGYTEKPKDEFRYVPLFARYPGMIDMDKLDPIHRMQIERMISYDRQSDAG